MILPVTVPVTVACLTVTVTASGRRRRHDSSFPVIVTLLSFTVTLSALRVSQSRPRLGAPGRPAPQPLLAAQRRRPCQVQWPAAWAGQMLGGDRPTALPPAVTEALSSLSRSSVGRIEKHLPCLVCGAPTGSGRPAGGSQQ